MSSIDPFWQRGPFRPVSLNETILNLVFLNETILNYFHSKWFLLKKPNLFWYIYSLKFLKDYEIIEFQFKILIKIY